VTRASINSPSVHAVIEDLPLVASASKGGLTLAVLLDTSGNKFSSSRNGLENIFESPATKLV
jgi:hypothetical protein